MRQVTVALFAMLAVAGCASVPTARSISGGCAVFDAPTQPVVGADAYSKRWAAKTVEAGVKGCGWGRPKLKAATS